MKRRLFHIVFLGLLLGAINKPGMAQDSLSPLSFPALEDSMNNSPKPIILEITTDWCRYCKLQKAQIKKDKILLDLLKDYYFVELDAEGKRNIEFDGKNYQYQSQGLSGGVHELAIHLAGNEHLSYPTWIFLNEQYQVVYRFGGVLKPNDLKTIIRHL
ncbi:hypothetical protein QWY93_14360 [Echinicola jeungdonensis]|uniref:Thioredoxin family protein n=1 Tax=Echinicola jeungdonensis TaxID=709343 RepID=A0ABV5JBA2_9BACT|nr:thioredoxin fold domain-containing protein [Echinicola jeungdonensis]MDN3670502.1 hypothetical protein [Echinicola jeungdonensis]